MKPSYFGPMLFLPLLAAVTLCGQTVDITAVATGNGVTDDTAAIQAAISGSPTGATIAFGIGKTYLVSQALELSSNRTYSGSAALKMNPATPASPGQVLLHAPAGDNITLDGLTLDGSGVAGLFAMSEDTIMHNLVIRNCTFLNSQIPAGLYNGAISAPRGILNGLIDKNTFINVGQLSTTNPLGLTISNNSWTGVLTDANMITIGLFGPGSGSIHITGNTATALSRMAIEIQAHTDDADVSDLTISNNTFTNWHSTANGDYTYGISLAMPIATNSIVSGNTLTYGNGSQSGYGVEAGAQGLVIDGNTITGWFDGVILNNGNGITVSNNHLNNQTHGIALSGSAHELDGNILNNTITDSGSSAIDMRGDTRGTAITGNVINRTAGTTCK